MKFTRVYQNQSKYNNHKPQSGGRKFNNRVLNQYKSNNKQYKTHNYKKQQVHYIKVPVHKPFKKQFIATKKYNNNNYQISNRLPIKQSTSLKKYNNLKKSKINKNNKKYQIQRPSLKSRGIQKNKQFLKKRQAFRQRNLQSNNNNKNINNKYNLKTRAIKKLNQRIQRKVKRVYTVSGRKGKTLILNQSKRIKKFGKKYKKQITSEMLDDQLDKYLMKNGDTATVRKHLDDDLDEYMNRSRLQLQQQQQLQQPSLLQQQQQFNQTNKDISCASTKLSSMDQQSKMMTSDFMKQFKDGSLGDLGDISSHLGSNLGASNINTSNLNVAATTNSDFNAFQQQLNNANMGSLVTLGGINLQGGIGAQ